jgi:transposase
MAKRIAMSKIREIIRIYSNNKNFSERQISRALNISRPVVHQWIIDFKRSGLSCDDIKQLNDDDLIDTLRNENKKKNTRYEILYSRFEYMSKELKKVGVTLLKLWEEYLEEYSDGYSYSQFLYHFQVWRNQSDISMHMEYKGGDIMFVDFTGKKLRITDRVTGKENEVETFIALLGASLYTYVEAVETQNKYDFISANENAFIYFDGVTKAIVPDCLKSGVKHACKYEPDINPDYADFAQHYDTVILPARPYKSQDKSLVENAVRLVYWWIYSNLRNRTFYSLEELNAAILIELEKFNNKKMQRMKISRKQLYLEVEKNELKSLPENTYEIKKFLFRKVQYNYHVYIPEDDHYYSVPYRFVGQKVKIICTKKTIDIYLKNKRIAFYKKVTTRNYTKKYTTESYHMPKNHAYVNGWSPERFINWGAKVGENVKMMIEKIFETKKHPQQGYKVCMGILNLEKKYTKDRLNNACKRALNFNYYSYKGVKKILENNLDKHQERDLFLNVIGDHENLRGSQYYN